MMVGVEGKSYEEVAATMGASVDAVRCDLSRSRERLSLTVYLVDHSSPCAGRPLRSPSAFRRLPWALVMEAAD